MYRANVQTLILRDSTLAPRANKRSLPADRFFAFYISTTALRAVNNTCTLATVSRHLAEFRRSCEMRKRGHCICSSCRPSLRSPMKKSGISRKWLSNTQISVEPCIGLGGTRIHLVSPARGSHRTRRSICSRSRIENEFTRIAKYGNDASF